MVLIIKEKSKYKPIIRKILSYGSLILMFTVYYFYMSDQFLKQNTKLSKELESNKQLLASKIELTKKVEKVIYKEAESCVDLIGQEKIQSIKIVKDKLYIVCDWDTDIEPLFIRYGIMALVKSTPENIKIAIDLQFIVESNYEA
ncbi:MAG: hypothetical protein PHF17_05775 [Arcobacteraceae bacterium]|jgi:hypothetical protein|nr:hypothetical protein [Arcobacteraceae bacterium]